MRLKIVTEWQNVRLVGPDITIGHYSPSSDMIADWTLPNWQ